MLAYCWALSWVDVGYVLARFLYVKLNKEKNVFKLFSHFFFIWSLGKICIDSDAGVGRLFCVVM